MQFFRRWSIDRVRRRLLELEPVYDVMCEHPAEDRYLVHVWVQELDARLATDLQPYIQRAAARRPKQIKIDVLLYRREAS